MTRPTTFAPPRRALLGLLPALALGACGNPDNQPQPIPTYTAPPPGLYQLGPNTPADGRLRVTLLRGAASARGVLTTNGGARIPFTITGVTTSDRPPARLELVGQVYGLPRTDIFFSSYRNVAPPPSARAELTDTPPIELQLGNDNLVVVRLMTARPGTGLLAIAPGGVTIAAAR